jgi:glucose-1-phosphatase
MAEGSKIRAVVWDMGGVLLRTEDYASRTELALQYGLTCRQLEDFVFSSESTALASIGQISAEEHWKNVAHKLNISDQELDSFINAFWAGDRLDQNLVQFIQRLRPQFAVGLLSNAWSNTRQMVENTHHFLDIFDATIFSAEVCLAKPDARIYHLMLDQLQAKPEETVFVDDFIENIDGASRVGMRTVRFQRADQVLRDLNLLLKNGA